MKRFLFALFLFVFTFLCSCSSHYEEQAQAFFSTLPSTATGYYLPNVNKGRTVLVVDSPLLYLFDLKDCVFTQISSSADRILDVKEDGFIYSKILRQKPDEPATGVNTLRGVYWYNFKSNEEEVIIEPKYFGEISNIIPLKNCAFLEICSEYGKTADYSGPTAIEDYQVFYYDSKEASSIRFVDKNHNIVHWKKMFVRSDMILHNQYVSIHFLSREKKDDIVYHDEYIFTIDPDINPQEAECFFKGNLLKSDDYILIKKNPFSYDVFDYRGHKLSQQLTARGFIANNGILDNNVIALLEDWGRDIVYYFSNDSDDILSTSIIRSFDAFHNKEYVYDRFVYGGKIYEVHVNDARMSKDQRYITLRAYNEGGYYLLRIQIDKPETGMSLIVSGSVITDYSTYYTVYSKNGNKQYYDHDGQELHYRPW